MSVRPSVPLSVKRRFSVETAKHIVKVVLPSDKHITILVFTYQMVCYYYDWNPLTGASNARGYEKSRFSTNMSLYLGNDTRAIFTVEGE